MRLPYSSEDMPQRSVLYMPFLLCIILAVSLSTGAAFSRLVLELGMFRIATKIYHDTIVDSKYPLSYTLSREMRSVHLVLSALLQNLDPDTDRFPVKELRNFLLEQDGILPEQPIRSKRNLLTSIHSAISYWRAKQPNILLLGPGESGKVIHLLFHSDQMKFLIFAHARQH
jgi:hypothetical protein